jgi:phage portal protein BeeE
LPNLLTRLREPRGAERFDQISLNDWAAMFTYGGLAYGGGPLGFAQTYPGAKVEEIGEDFRGYANGLYRRNGVVFACALVRMLLFAEARFTWRRLRSGRVGDTFGTQELAPLENPWPNGTTGDLLARAEQDVTLAGNFYAYLDKRRGPPGVVRRMRPDWVEIILGSESNPDVSYGDLDCEVVGYRYYPGGPGGTKPPVTLFRDQVAHYAPIPDPDAAYRGMSWLTPVIRETMGDQAATEHKLKFFENSGTPNLAIKIPAQKVEEFNKWVERYREGHEGLRNAYKNLYLGAGADVTPIGLDLKQLDFKIVQGHGETRLAAAAGVPPVIVGLSEGLDAATYSNYSQARRRLSDGTMYPLWRNVCGSFTPLVNVPGGAQLWFDTSDIPFLREDEKDAAEVQSLQATAINALVTAGYDPATVIDAVVAGDYGRLAHTGLFSVQLQKPGQPNAAPPMPVPPAPPNGTPAPPARASSILADLMPRRN